MCSVGKLRFAPSNLATSVCAQVILRDAPHPILLMTLPVAHPIRTMRPVFLVHGVSMALAMLALTNCARQDKNGKVSAQNRQIALYNAASIARPLKALADSFTAKTGIAVVQESQSSLELARRITEFNEIPDVIALADYKVFPTLLSPKWVDGWWLFARNRLVIAYTGKSKYQADLANDGWRQVLTRDDVEVGRSDPNTDPSGYRTLMAFQLAELHYAEKGLAARLLAGAAARNIRPREADQVGMLQAGALDYIWTYENLAKGAALKYLTLPPSIDLGSAADSLTYAHASVRVAGKQRGDTVTFTGEPILYAVAIPLLPPDSASARQFVRYMLSDDGRRIMRSAALDALDAPIAAGKAGVP
jgi:molybdate/tungstate transport system substrate-binding protein